METQTQTPLSNERKLDRVAATTGRGPACPMLLGAKFGTKVSVIAPTGAQLCIDGESSSVLGALSQSIAVRARHFSRRATYVIRRHRFSSCMPSISAVRLALVPPSRPQQHRARRQNAQPTTGYSVLRPPFSYQAFPCCTHSLRVSRPYRARDIRNARGLPQKSLCVSIPLKIPPCA